MPSYVQSNTQEGLIVATASGGGGSLYGKEGYFAQISPSGTSGFVILPAVSGSICPYVIEEGEASGATGTSVVLRPLTPSRNVRVYMAVTASAGAHIMCAALGAGTLYVPSANGKSYALGVLENYVVTAGTYGLMRPLGPFSATA